MTSIKKNFVYSSFLTLSGYIFPLLTFPYVTRVLGVENLGLYNFVDSTISYFCVFALLGINTVGIREIAKAKGNKEQLSVAFNSLLFLNLITTFIAIGVLLVLLFTIPKFYEHQDMFYLGVARILFNSLLIEWFYQGLENFKYITNRSILVKCVYVAAVFLLVKNRNDYFIYYLLTVLTFVVNAIINICYSKKFVNYTFKDVTFKPFVVPFLTIGLYRILTAMYMSFNVTFLGMTCGEVEVGYYSTATKLYAVIISLFSAFTGVMLPRLSSIVAENNMSEFKRLTNKSIDALLAFVMPLIVISELYAPQIIRIIAGVGYEGAILPMRIVMPLMLLIGYEQIIIIQMLSPNRKDKAILINSLFGASVALLLNIIIVPKLASVGSSVVWVASEFAVALSAQYFVNRYFGYKVPIKKIITRIISSIPILLACIFISSLFDNDILLFLLGSFLVVFYFLLIEYSVLKNELVITSLSSIIGKCVRRFH